MNAKLVDLEYRTRIITRKEMAKRLGVTERTLINWHNNGLFRHRKAPSGSAFYTEGDYLDYLEASKNENSADVEYRTRIVSRDEMAKRLGVAQRTLSNWHKNKTFQHRKTPSGEIFYTEGDYLDYLESSKWRSEE